MLHCCFATVTACIVHQLACTSGLIQAPFFANQQQLDISIHNLARHSNQLLCLKVLCVPVASCSSAGIAHHVKCQQLITYNSHWCDQVPSALSHCQCVMQLTGTPDGGCHVEHKLKVQPVLDAPALFSKSALSTCSCSCCI